VHTSKVLSSGRFCRGKGVVLRAQFSWHTDPFFLVRVPSVTLACTITSAGVSCLHKVWFSCRVGCVHERLLFAAPRSILLSKVWDHAVPRAAAAYREVSTAIVTRGIF